MHLFARLKKSVALSLTFALVLSMGTGIWQVQTVSANGSSMVDVLDPDFIQDHGGHSVSVTADPDRSPYEVFGEAFGTDNPVEGATKTARAILGTEVERHVANYYDEDLGKYVFKVELNGNDCYTCYLHNATYNPATGKFEGGNDDRQRIEIRPAEESRDLIGLENEITAFNWKLKIDKEVSKPDGFFHIFQYKAYNSTGRDVQSLPLHDSVNFPDFSSSEDGNPILTFTVSSSATQNLEFRYADIGTDAGQETLAKIPLNDIKDRWVDITVKLLNSEYGWVTMTMKDAQTGEVLMEYNDPDRVLDLWRRPEIKYNGKTFEGPYPAVSNMINRPKWGIYRKADKSNPNVKDAKIYLADMTLYKSAVGVSPVNLAYGKTVYNTGAVSGNAFQLANAKPERLTDGVQIDPVSYANLTAVPADNFSALGDLSWIGTESSKKGNVIVDLGKQMDFNQLKLFAKTARLKYVNVWVSDDSADHSEDELSAIAFTPVDPSYDDGNGKTFAYFNADNGGGNDAGDQTYLIDLGKTYSTRYLKLYFENGSGSNGAGVTNGIPTFTMTGPPRMTELEIYNAPLTPSNVSVDYKGGSEATISWGAVPADYFVVYDNGKPIADQVASNSVTLTNLDPGAIYYLSVRTVYTDPYSFKPMLSAESEVKTLITDGDPLVPNPPNSVTATAASDKTIDVSWDEVPDAQSYRVTLATDASDRIVTDDYKGISYTIKDLAPGTVYTVKVYSIRRGALSTAAAAAQTATSGIRHGSDNLLYQKEVQYPRVWNDDTSSYGAHKALDNDTTGSRWVALKGSATSWMTVDIGEIVPVSTLEYYSFQNNLKRVSFYYATDSEAFTDPDSDRWLPLVTDDRAAQGKYGDPAIKNIEASIALSAPVNARYIKFSVDEVDGDINVNEVKAFGPMSFIGNSALNATNNTETSIDLSWASSQTTLPVSSYDVYNGNAKLATVTSSVYQYKVTGLAPDTAYTFRVRAVHETVTGSVYATLGGLTAQASTLTDTQEPGNPGSGNPGPSNLGSSGPGSSHPGPSDPVDSKSPVARLDLVRDAAITLEKAEDGRTVTKVTIKADRLRIVAVGKQFVELSVDSDDRDVIVELPGAALLESESLIAIRIEANGTHYELPLRMLNRLTTDDRVSVFIGVVTGQRLEKMNLALADAGVRQLLPAPIEFRLMIGNREATDFGGYYAERKIRLPQPANPKRTTAVWIDDDLELHFVPAVIHAVNDGSEVVIRTPHNSVYTIIESNKSFEDLQGHWAREDVQLLANKRIIFGQSDKIYNPRQPVTRAEFTAMLVRALGLLEESSSSFTDVPSNAWFAGAVGTAKKYGLIAGFEDGTFRPQDRITREQMAVMAAGALKAAGRAPAAPPSQATFADYGEIGPWSREAVGQLAALNLIRGTGDGSFAPRLQTTRAEAASLLKRVLQHLDFIN